MITFHEKEMIIHTNSGFRRLEYHKIIAITTDRPYIVIWITGDEKKILIKSCLGEIINELPAVFYWCNQSAIVNLHHLKLYDQKSAPYFLYLTSGMKLKIPRRKREEFQERLSFLNRNCALNCNEEQICNKACMTKSG